MERTWTTGSLRDTLTVFVWDTPRSVHRHAPVYPDGKITTPLAENVRAADRTPDGLALAIKQKLSDFVRNPNVTVTVTEFVCLYCQQIRVLGNGVKKPKSPPYREGMTLLDLIIAVGGATEFAEDNDAVLLRAMDGQMRKFCTRLGNLFGKGDITANAEILLGDILIVPETISLAMRCSSRSSSQ